MLSENHEKGAFQVSRSLFDSDIWFKPPEYLKIWIYLIGKANHKAKKYKGFYCERGQYFCDYKELKEQLTYKAGYREIKPNENLMKDIMKHLRHTLRITTMKQPRGILITIVNYDKYQDLKNYESSNEATNETPTHPPHILQNPLSINKNGKNERMKEKNIYTDQKVSGISIESEQHNTDVVNSNNTDTDTDKPYSASSTNIDNPDNNFNPEQAFQEWYDEYPLKSGLKEAKKVFVQCCQDKKTLKYMLYALEKQKVSKSWKDGYIQNPVKYLENQKWKEVEMPYTLYDDDEKIELIDGRINEELQNALINFSCSIKDVIEWVSHEYFPNYRPERLSFTDEEKKQAVREFAKKIQKWENERKKLNQPMKFLNILNNSQPAD